jgi:hypothetical protein
VLLGAYVMCGSSQSHPERVPKGVNGHFSPRLGEHPVSAGRTLLFSHIKIECDLVMLLCPAKEEAREQLPLLMSQPSNEGVGTE